MLTKAELIADLKGLFRARDTLREDIMALEPDAPKRQPALASLHIIAGAIVQVQSTLGYRPRGTIEQLIDAALYSAGHRKKEGPNT